MKIVYINAYDVNVSIVVQDPPEGFFSFEENVKNDVMLEMKSKCRIISDL